MAALPITGRVIFGRQRTDQQAAVSDRGHVVSPEKKPAEAIRQEVAREIVQLLRFVFSGRGKTGRLDMEAVEAAVRAAVRRAGTTELNE